MGEHPEPFVKRMPTQDELFWPSLQTIKSLGGSASISEHVDQLIKSQNVPPDLVAEPHGDSGRTELEYRLAWSRTALKRCGYLENSARGVWSLTDAGEEATEGELKERIARLRSSDSAKSRNSSDRSVDNNSQPPTTVEWTEELLSKLKKIDPNSFERLAQRVLRESGFIKVEVTGRSGDGGIDGTGILQLSLMSFHVLFQCKRYQGSVGAREVRDFRGAMMGRTDKGLLITTGTFSPDARREATRDGAPPIDLIDGVSLCEKLKELKLGVRTELVEDVTIVSEWFDQL